MWPTRSGPMALPSWPGNTTSPSMWLRPSRPSDMTLPEGSLIPIEERASSEITHGMGKQTAPETVTVYNPAFDVTPNRLVNAIITDRGVAESPVRTGLQEMVFIG